MNYSLKASPLTQITLTREKMTKWVEAQTKGEKADLDVYGKPTEKQLKELENVRNLSKELQDNLHEIENTPRIADVDNQAMNPTAPILDISENHEFVSANNLDNYYAEEDKVDAKEEERRRIALGKGEKTEIQQFYKDQCVFLTGGTGFLGKVIIEKLLRSCGDIDTIYVLIRSKRGINASARLNDLLNDFLFHKAHDINPKGIYKVVAIAGDMMSPGLGITEEDRKTLISKVSVIINAAATVRFDEKLPAATKINVSGTLEVLKLAKECRNLKAITHVSTAYSNTQYDYIEEKFYNPTMSAESLQALCCINEDIINNITPMLLDKHPNTYTFTKAIAEDAVRKNGEGLPICIVRPSIVVSTYEEPIRGWTDSMYGPAGIIIGVGTGVLRAMYIDVDKVADMVPVDLTVNAILSSVWYTAKHFKENQTSNIPIYNFVSGAQNPLTWRKFIDYNKKYGINIPTTKAVWYYGLNCTANYNLFLLYNFFLHFIPALFIDAISTLTGRRTRMIQLYKKVTKLANILFFFSLHEWKFQDDGVRRMWESLSSADKIVFPFCLKNIDWIHQMETFLYGIRVYLVKDDLVTLPEARKKWNRLYYMHQTLKAVVVVLLLNTFYFLIKFLF